MKILAIDTSNLPLCIAICNEEKVLGEITTNVQLNHSVRLMPALETLLRDVKMSLREIDLIAVARGPGSYTGVRIGVTTAKTIAWALGKPLVGVSSLMAIAHQIPFYPGILLPFFDARRDRVYAGGYAWNGDQLEEVIEEQVIHIRDLADLLREKKEKVLFLGEPRFRAAFQEWLGAQAQFLTPEYFLPRASHIARIGLKRFQSGLVEDLFFAPQYLQKSEAEVRFGASLGEKK